MNIFNIKNSLFPFYTPQEISLNQQFENAIDTNKIDSLKELASNHPEILSKPLPNGQLPLNYAIRSSKINSIHTLLDLGCNPNLKDDQALNAFTTAYFKENYTLVVELLNDYLKRDLKLAEEINENKILLNKTSKFLNLVKSKLTHAQEIKEYKTLISLHIKQNKPLNSLTPHQDITPLQFAILNEDIPLITQLLELPLYEKELNQTDEKGLLPIHYAAGMGRVDIMKLLIDRGALLNVDDGNFSPFAILAAYFNEKYPFHISKYEIAVFLSSLILWSAQLAPKSLLNPQILQAAILFTYIPLLFELKTVLKTTLSFTFLSYLIGNANIFEHINLFFSASATLKLASTLFFGIRRTWKNCSLNYSKSLLKAVVIYTPKASMCLNTLSNVGKHFGLLSSSFSNDLSKLSMREILCLNYSYFGFNPPQSTSTLQICLDKSKTAFYTCSDVSQNLPCLTAEKEIDNYLNRLKIWNLNKSSLEISEESQEKWTLWKNQCTTDFQDVKCLKAEKSYIDFLQDYIKKQNEERQSKQNCNKDAISQLTGSSTATWNECKKAYRKIASQFDPHNDQIKLIDLNNLYDKSKACF